MTAREIAEQLQKAARDLQQTAEDWQEKVAVMPTLFDQQMALVTLLNEAAAALAAQQAETREEIIDYIERHGSTLLSVASVVNWLRTPTPASKETD